MPIRRLLLHDPRRALPAALPDVIVLDASEAGPPLPAEAASEERPSPFHRRPCGPGLYLRLPPLSCGSAESDLARAAGLGVDGLVLTGAAGRLDVEHLGAKLAVIEAERGLPDGGLRILAVAADTPAGVLALPAFAATPRLVGLACDPERLAFLLGCGPDAPAIAQARALTVLAAAACRVQAVLVGTSLAAADLAAAGREGFGAVLAPAGVRRASGAARRISSRGSRRNNRDSRPA